MMQTIRQRVHPDINAIELVYFEASLRACSILTVQPADWLLRRSIVQLGAEHTEYGRRVRFGWCEELKTWVIAEDRD